MISIEPQMLLKNAKMNGVVKGMPQTIRKDGSSRLKSISNLIQDAH